MSFLSLFQLLNLRPVRARRRPTAACRPLQGHLQIEPLEDRNLLANYTFTDLGNLAGSGYESQAIDLNASGKVVGITYDRNNGYQARAALWVGNTFTSLGTLGGAWSGANAINDLGQIVGWSSVADGSYRGFLINPEDTNGDNSPDRWFRDLNADGTNDLMIELPLRRASNINNLGQVVGAGLSDFDRSFLWTPDISNGTTGSMISLGLSAAAINDLGQIVGSTSIDGESHAVLWQNGVTIDLGYGYANAINNSGQVVGHRTYLARGFLWTPSAPNNTSGTFNYLQSYFDGDPFNFGWNANNATSDALGLNNAGQVVGESHYVENGGWGEGGVYFEDRIATLWVGGTLQSLTDHVVPALRLGTAWAINDNGQIIAHTYSGSTDSGRPVLLTPISVPQISISDAMITEGNTGTRAVSFTVTLSAASTQTVTIAFATANVTAIAGSDYVATSGTLTFAPGQTRLSITVPVKGDRVPEPNETFVVYLSNATNASILDNTGVGAILDDEPRISISDISMKEGRSGQTTLFVFTISLSATYDQAVTMSYQTVNGTARAGTDYRAKSGTLAFKPGETTKTITIEVIGNNKRESNKSFYLDLLGNSSNSMFTKNRGIGTILNDD